ncbi:MAG: hypothetical protein AB7N53_15875 [Candidatus Binatia bacterium]
MSSRKVMNGGRLIRLSGEDACAPVMPLVGLRAGSCVEMKATASGLRYTSS